MTAALVISGTDRVPMIGFEGGDGAVALFISDLELANNEGDQLLALFVGRLANAIRTLNNMQRVDVI